MVAAPIHRLIHLFSMRPEPAEVLINLVALGMLWNFANPERFGQQSATTTVAVIDAVGANVAIGWALATAIMPLVSIASGQKKIRLASTFLCGLIWTAIIYFSWQQGTYVSLTVALGVAGLGALLWSQIVIMQTWRNER